MILILAMFDCMLEQYWGELPPCRGFPPAITELKRALSEASPGLKAENPGSRWPKTSMGALGDRQRLTPQQLQLLNAICRYLATLNISALQSARPYCSILQDCLKLYKLMNTLRHELTVTTMKRQVLSTHLK